LLVFVIAAAVLFVIRARGRYETQNIISGDVSRSSWTFRAA